VLGQRIVRIVIVPPLRMICVSSLGLSKRCVCEKMISANVTGSAIWGHAATRYAVYKIDITHDGQFYSVYRRYSAFYTLHQMVYLFCYRSSMLCNMA
jgi:uncharacterized membrane protein YbhN (UPF0104 family)